MALEVHKDQAYYGTRDDYRRGFVDFHLRPGIQTIRLLGGSLDDQAAFWLHDAVEDTDITLADLEEQGFPTQVVAAVDRLTWSPGQSYQQHLQRAASLPETNRLKLIDSKGNLDAALELQPHIPSEEYEICMQKYAGNIIFLAAQLAEPGYGPRWEQFIVNQVNRAGAILHERDGQPAGLPAPALLTPSLES